MIQLKCSDCKKLKMEVEFYKNKTTKTGRYPKCRDCYNVYVKEWRAKNPDKVQKYLKKHYEKYDREYFRKYEKARRKMNPAKSNQKIYDWYADNVQQFVSVQLKYQSKIPPHVYSITYKDTVVYVGSSNMPLRRQNVHLSTIRTPNNIGKINKLHSFLGYDKKDFNFNLVEQVDDITQLKTRESYYEYYYQAGYNYKKMFGEVEKTKDIVERVFGK
jgi:ribosomal protein S8